MRKTDDAITMSAVGDIMMGWGVEENIKKYGEGFPFGHVAHILKDSDINFGNLEGPITDRDDKAIWDYSKVLDRVVVNGKVVGTSIYCKSPLIAADKLKRARFHVVSIANNHIMDYGESGLLDTLKILSESGIKYVGAGKNIAEARRPVVLQRKGVNVGFLAYCDVYQASNYRPGAAPVACSKEDIKKLRASADVVVVSLHQGQYFASPSPADIKTSRRMIDLGADLVLMHGPHILKGIETYHNGTIAYSIGNFVFDNTIDPSMPFTEESRESMILQARLTKRKAVSDVSPIPILIDHGFQPVIPTESVAEKILERIRQLSINIEADSMRLWEKELEYKYARTMMPIMGKMIVELVRNGRVSDLLQLLRRVKSQDIKAVVRYLSHALSSNNEATSSNALGSPD